MVVVAAIAVIIVVVWFGFNASATNLTWKARAKRIDRLRRRRAKLTERIKQLYGSSGNCCPNCLRWPWDDGSAQSWTDTSQPAVMTCGACGFVSLWADGMGMIHVPPPPAPIDIE